MQYIVTSEEMKFYDESTIRKVGIPALVLMERAALETADIIWRNAKKISRIIVFAGTGNNGGDGLAVGRILSQRGIDVTFYLVGDESRVSEETKTQISIIRNLGLSILSKLPQAEYDIVIDSLFGTGLSRNIAGVYEKAVKDIGALKARGAMERQDIIFIREKKRRVSFLSDISVLRSSSFPKRGHLIFRLAQKR